MAAGPPPINAGPASPGAARRGLSDRVHHSAAVNDMSLPENDDEILLLHNPRCSKSRRVKALLEERGVEFEERRYLDQPLTAEELADLESRLARPVREWVRAGEAAFAEAGLDDTTDEAALRAAVAERPVLLERPIVVRGRRARVGRPPEAALELLD